VGDLSYSWAKDFEASRASNQTKINRLTTRFSWACVLTGAQVIAWGLGDSSAALVSVIALALFQVLRLRGNVLGLRDC
jgi:hypothetical protein